MPKRLPKVISRDEAKRILEVPNTDNKTGLRQKAVLETLYRAGLRASEIRDLRVEDAKIGQNRLDVRGSKRAQSRAVPIDDRLAGWLQAWSNIRPECEWFFCTFESTQIYTQWLRAMVSSVVEKAGLDPKQVSPHTFRHTYATELIEDGFSLREVQQLLGHRSVETTQVYLHVRPQELERKIHDRHEQEENVREEIAGMLDDMSNKEVRVLRKLLGRVKT